MNYCEASSPPRWRPHYNWEGSMYKFILAAPGVFVLGGLAFAAGQSWNITEEGISGVKGAQGTWIVNTDASNKITGSANLQLDNGSTRLWAR
jgi:hypothetical protein